MAKLTKSQKLNNLNKLNTIIDRSKKHAIGEEKVLDAGFDGIISKTEDLELDCAKIKECAKLQKDIHSKLLESVKALEKIYKDGDAKIDEEANETDDEE